ncbi:MAG: ABC transporter ATP-binding protein, partial [Tistlia sp.]
MLFPFRARPVQASGDDSPARHVFSYVWRMSGHHQVWLCLLALFLAALGVAPLELQRRIVDGALEGSDAVLLWWLCGFYLVVVLTQASAKYALRLYQSWLAESAILYTRRHLSRLYETRAEERARSESGEGGQAVSIIGAEVEKLGGFV